METEQSVRILNAIISLEESVKEERYKFYLANKKLEEKIEEYNKTVANGDAHFVEDVYKSMAEIMSHVKLLRYDVGDMEKRLKSLTTFIKSSKNTKQPKTSFWKSFFKK
jgi:hypothetical protein